MRRIPLALALVGAVAVTGCMGGSKSSATTDSDVQKGVTGSYYYINIKPPVGGSITSNIGGINCGASAVTVDNAVNPPQYSYTYISSACGINGQTQIPWASPVVLTAVPAAGKAFIGWAGDCSGTALTCTVSTASNGADKTVIAIFGEPGSGHGMPFPGSVHGPALSAGTLACYTCHGNVGQGQGMAPACTACHDWAPPPVAKTGLKVIVNSVGGTTVYFSVQDNAGNPVDVTGADGKNKLMSLRAALASFGTDSAGNVLAYAVRTGTATSPTTVTMPALGTATGANTLTRSAPGVYAFTFPSTVTYDGAAVTADVPHTVWIQATRQENLSTTTNDTKTFTAVNAQFNYSPQTGNPVAAREVVSQAACDNCHNGFKPRGPQASGFHGAGRVAAAYCNVCHNPARTAGSGAAADSAVFVHRIHGAHQTGLPTTLWFDGIAATYPQDVRNCNSCHGGAAQGAQYEERVTVNACGSCHWNVDFVATASTLPAVPVCNDTATPAGVACRHSGGASIPESLCSTCHGVGSAFSVASSHIPLVSNGSTTAPADYSAGPVRPAAAKIITYDIASVGTWTDNSSTTPVRRPQIAFKLKVDGVDQDFGAFNATTKPELITGFTGNGPTVYFAWAVPQDGVAAPADFNTSANIALKTCWSAPATSCYLTRDTTTGYYTLQLRTANITPDAKLLTGGLGYTGPMIQTLAGFTGTGIQVPTTNAWKVADGFTGRRVVVDTAGCTACHAQLGVAPTFHSGGRNDAPTCSFCHTGNRTSNGWSGNQSTFIHAIHGSLKRSVGYTWAASACPTGYTWDTTAKVCSNGTETTLPAFFPPEIEYPQSLTNCTACHTAGGFDFSANSAAVPSLLWTTVATGTFTTSGTTAVIRNSPYVTVGTNYGSGFSFSQTTGLATQAASTTLVSSPISAACYSCHDTAGAKSHMEAQGGWIYRARGAGFAAPANAEGCLGCHGAGKAFPIDVVHK